VSPDGSEAFPEEFLPKPQVEFTQEEDIRPVFKKKKTIKISHSQNRRSVEELPPQQEVIHINN